MDKQLTHGDETMTLLKLHRINKRLRTSYNETLPGTIFEYYYSMVKSVYYEGRLTLERVQRMTAISYYYFKLYV